MNKSELKDKIVSLVSRPSKVQMDNREELIKALESYLIVCETPEDLNVLNNWGKGVPGLWLGDARIIALLGSAGARIYGNVNDPWRRLKRS